MLDRSFKSSDNGQKYSLLSKKRRALIIKQYSRSKSQRPCKKIRSFLPKKSRGKFILHFLERQAYWQTIITSKSLYYLPSPRARKFFEKVQNKIPTVFFFLFLRTSNLTEKPDVSLDILILCRFILGPFPSQGNIQCPDKSFRPELIHIPIFSTHTLKEKEYNFPSYSFFG